MLETWDNTNFWKGDETFISGEMPGLREFAENQAETRGLIFFRTSGSEGLPKWVGISREAFLASGNAVNSHLEATAADHWLIALPVNHVGGFSILVRSFLSGASWTVMPGKWDPPQFADLCTAGGTTLTSLVPTQVYDLVEAAIPAPACLRAIVVGGGALSKDVGERALKLGWPVLQSYGMTETASQVATEPLDHLYAGFDPDALEVLPGWQLETASDDCLIVRGPALASGYASQEDGQWTWQHIDPAAGLKTRDHVQLWQHGTRQYLSFQGRDASYVKILGELVNLTALKKRLDEDAVKEAALNSDAFVIWPMPDERKGTRLLLAGVADEARLERIREVFNATTAGYERLDAVRALPALPRTALGKIDNAALTRLLQDV